MAIIISQAFMIVYHEGFKSFRRLVETRSPDHSKTSQRTCISSCAKSFRGQLIHLTLYIPARGRHRTLATVGDENSVNPGKSHSNKNCSGTSGCNTMFALVRESQNDMGRSDRQVLGCSTVPTKFFLSAVFAISRIVRPFALIASMFSIPKHFSGLNAAIASGE
jgi:hypothetical protein